MSRHARRVFAQSHICHRLKARAERIYANVRALADSYVMPD